MVAGTELIPLSIAHAIFQLLPALLYAAVLDYLSLNETKRRAVVFVLGVGLALAAATTSLHGFYFYATPAGGIELGPLGYACYLFGCGVVGLAVYTCLLYTSDAADE